MSTSEEARQQAQAERLTLPKANNKTGFFGVCLAKPGQPKPYQARVSRGGKLVQLGCFATTEEAALCVARSPEGKAAAQRAARAVPPLTSEEARQHAQAERLTLLKANNKTGYFGVALNQRGKLKPFAVRVWRGGKAATLGHFATAEEAALCVARTPEGRAAAQRAAAAPPLTSGEARQQAQAERLTLIKANNKTGHFGVYVANPGNPKPYQAQVKRGGKVVQLGCFATAEEAAFCVARTPEGQTATSRAHEKRKRVSKKRKRRERESDSVEEEDQLNNDSDENESEEDEELEPEDDASATSSEEEEEKRGNQKCLVKGRDLAAASCGTSGLTQTMVTVGKSDVSNDDGSGGDDAGEVEETTAAAAVEVLDALEVEVEALSDGDDEVPFVDAVLVSE